MVESMARKRSDTRAVNERARDAEKPGIIRRRSGAVLATVGVIIVGAVTTLVTRIARRALREATRE